jgi:hypothetical protein
MIKVIPQSSIVTCDLCKETTSEGYITIHIRLIGKIDKAYLLDNNWNTFKDDQPKEFCPTCGFKIVNASKPKTKRKRKCMA